MTPRFPLIGIDVETTGDDPTRQDVVQVSAVTETGDRPFVCYLDPQRPENADPVADTIHGIDWRIVPGVNADTAADRFATWCQRVNRGRPLMPVAHQWAFDASWLSAWLGPPLFRELFHVHGRCTLQMAAHQNDLAELSGRPKPYPVLSLVALCAQFAIPYETAHDAQADASAALALYHHLLSAAVNKNEPSAHVVHCRE